MVVFEDGLARKSEYRRFTVRGTEGQDDVAAIHEVVTRRFRRYLEDRENVPELDLGREEDDGNPGDDDRSDPAAPSRIDASPIDPVTGRPRRFAYPPNLVVVDGGPPQVAAAARALAELGIDDVALCGLAKRLEEVWLPEDDHPVVLPRTSEGLYLLQRVRDEAHRFAITHHRQRRSKAMTTSVLDEVPGLGPARQKALLRAFGSVKRLRAASAEEIASVQGIGPALAQAVVGALATRSPEPAVDTATGEIIE
jgi:excinuclease ABC subunit C